MNGIFIYILSMSITAGYCIVAVILIRFLLRRQPKIFSYLLWGIVLFRLLCPFSISSPFSILPVNPETALQERMGGSRSAAVSAAWQGKTDSYADGSLFAGTEIGEAAGPGENIEEAGETGTGAKLRNGVVVLWNFLSGGMGSRIWLWGMILLTGYGIVTAVQFRVFLKGAVWLSDDIYELEGLPTPFVFGILRPRVYLPAHLSDEERRYVLEHERVHMARGDHLIKLTAWAVRDIHWFNPLVWLAFALMENDMEMSCDEAVLRKLGEGVRQEYSRALLALSCEKRLNGCPLAFGEGKVKSRILNILTCRERTFAAVLAATVLVILAVLGLSLNPVGVSRQEKSEAVLAFATDYANAFVGRDGRAMVGLYADEETAFENVILLEETDGEYTFGYSSPWPDEYRLTVDEEGQQVSIRYYAGTSDPHATVWKEKMSFAETEDGYRVTDSKVQVFDSITSLEEYEEAYWAGDGYQFVDYAERGYVAAINYQTEHDREEGVESDRNAVYRSPRTAAEHILNLTGGACVASSDSSGQAVVKYTFEDGSSIAIPMYNANYTSATGNTTEPYNDDRGAGDVWIVDVEAWNVDRFFHSQHDKDASQHWS